MKSTFNPTAPIGAATDTPRARGPMPPPVKKAAKNWITAGILLILGGIIMLPTMALTAIGAVMILIGIALITASFLRISR